jgi:TM2 domain-containing membrane protein YozV
MTTVCPYCRTPFEPDDEVITCEACSTPHHADCYAENAGCTVFGCTKAPLDEPKISIAAADLNAPAAAPLAAAPARPTPPPPPRAGSSTSIPPPPRADGSVAFPAYGVRIGEETNVPAPRALSFGGYNDPQPVALPFYIPRRSRLTYILLGILLGAFGGHNFYAGYTKRAVIQLLLTILTCFFGAIISWIWAIVEVCTITQDDDGVAFI